MAAVSGHGDILAEHAFMPLEWFSEIGLGKSLDGWWHIVMRAKKPIGWWKLDAMAVGHVGPTYGCMAQPL